MPSVRVTTDPGIEDIAAAEITRLLSEVGITVSKAHEQPGGLKGVVVAELPADSDADDETALCNRVWEALSRARLIYHVVVQIGEVEWKGQPLDALATEIAALPFARMERPGSFRASCSRSGEHPFHSPDVEVAVGTALQNRYGTAVDLEHYDVNVRVDIVGSRCLCGYQLTGKKGLDRRHRWQYHPRVTLRTTVAYAMLQIAGFVANPGDLHDPFCGSGTILLEARAGATAAAPRIAGSDRSWRAVEGCRSNLEAAGIARDVEVSRMNVRDLSDHLPAASLDYIVTNPPFGIRMGHDADLGALYRLLLEQAAVVLRPGGVLALLVGKRRGRFNKILQSIGEFRLEHVRIIEIGGVYPGLFVLRRSTGPV